MKRLLCLYIFNYPHNTMSPCGRTHPSHPFPNFPFICTAGKAMSCTPEGGFGVPPSCFVSFTSSLSSSSHCSTPPEGEASSLSLSLSLLLLLLLPALPSPHGEGWGPAPSSSVSGRQTVPGPDYQACREPRRRSKNRFSPGCLMTQEHVPMRLPVCPSSLSLSLLLLLLTALPPTKWGSLSLSLRARLDTTSSL